MSHDNDDDDEDDNDDDDDDYLQVAVQEICLARMLKLFSVVTPPAP